MDQKMKATNQLLPGITFLLVLLWSYTASSKLIDHSVFQQQLSALQLGTPLSVGLAWFIPLAELLAAIGLLFSKRRSISFLLSIALLLLFSGYIAAGLLGLLPQKPCSCGGVLRQLNWRTHLLFNLFFLGISMLGWRLNQRLNRKNWS